MTTKRRVPIFRHWDSWGEFLDKIGVVNPELGNPSVAFRETPKGSGKYAWFGDTVGMPDALTLARQGWVKGEKRVRDISARLFNSVAARIGREEFVPDVTGLFFDVPSVVRGTPDAWFDIEIREGEGRANRHVHIIYNIAVSHSVPEAVIVARGSAVAALIELLEYGGCAVSLDVCDVAGGSHKTEPTWATFVRIKQAGQPLELARLAFAIAHPATPRRLFFSAMEHEDAETRALLGATGEGGWYGTPVDLPRYHWPDENCLYLGCARNDTGTDWQDPKEAEKWIVKQLTEQGLTVEDYQGVA